MEKRFREQRNRRPLPRMSYLLTLLCGLLWLPTLCDGFIVPLQLIFSAEIAGDGMLVYAYIISFFALGYWASCEIT